MKNINHFFIAVLLTVCNIVGYAQQDTSAKIGIKVIARVQQTDITLRWGANTAVAWQYANKYGYMVERYTLVKKGKVLAQPIVTKITQEPVKPQPLEAWETLAKKEKYAAIAAQALYGKTFEINAKNNNVFSMVNKAEEQETRFSFAMFCADQSLEVANLMGLKLTDKFIFAGERYLYKVYALVPKSILAIDTAYVFVDANQLQVLPKPQHLKADFADKTVMLSWDNVYDDLYSSYFIERSEDDGKTFITINQDPYLTATPNAKQKGNSIFMLDSLPANNQKYNYRIKGKSYFGEMGPASDPVQGMAITKPKALPIIAAAKILNNTQALLSWDFPIEMNTKINGFQLATATSLAVPLQNTGKLIAADKREWLLEKLQPSGYYGIKAIDAQGNEYPSAPYLVQLKDNTPPPAPTALKGKIDTLGIVRMQWKSSTAADLEGYRIYMANSLNDEFSQVTKTHLHDTTFTDTTQLQTLSEKIYYKIVAIDHHFNISTFSELLTLLRPDKVPPAPAVIISCVGIDSGVVIQYIPSVSKDVVKHMVYRKSEGSAQWVKIAAYDSTHTTHRHLDRGSDLKTIFQYTIVAQDESNNITYAVQPATAKRFDNYQRAEIKKFTALADRTARAIALQWQYRQEAVSKILVYRAEDNQPLRLYKTLAPLLEFYEDKAIKIGSTYIYKLKAVFSDGGSSPMSKEIIVKF